MKVLIPVDGSEQSRATLSWVTETLDKAANRYVLLTVVNEPLRLEYQVEDAVKVLDESRALLQQNGCQVEKSEYVAGDPVDRICQVAEEEKVDQVLVGSHGRSGLAKALLGSVSEGVLERCSKPVFIYRPSKTGRSDFQR